MLKQRFLVQFGTSLSIQILAVISGLIVARVAGPSVVGIVSYGTAYVSLLGFINGLFGSGHIKLVSEGRDHGSCMAVFTRFQTISAIIYFIATLTWFLTQKYILRYPFESKEIQIVVIIALFSHFISMYEQYAAVVFTARLRQAKANLPNFFRSILWHIGRVVIVILGYRAVVLSLWNLLLGILLVPYVYKLLKDSPKGKYDPQLAREYGKYALPILIIVIINSVISQSDKLFLAHYTNTTQLGYYSAAFGISGMFMLIAAPVGNIFFPLFSGMIATGDWDGVNRNIRMYHEFIVLFIFPLINVLAIAGGSVLLLVLGKRYLPSIIPFSILLYATYVVLVGLPYGNVIVGMGKFYLYVWTNVIKLIVFAISITIFISPKFLNLGATGLALNLLVMNFTGNFLNLLFAKKFGKIVLNLENNLRLILILTITAIFYIISIYAKAWNTFWWVYFAPIYMITTYLAIYLTGLIKKEHLVHFLDALNINKTLKYVDNEMRGNGKVE